MTDPARQTEETAQAVAPDLQHLAQAVAHEFKAPLVTLQGFVRGLEQVARRGDWHLFQEDVQRILRIGQNLQSTVDAVLALVCADAGRIRQEQVSLVQAAEEAMEMLAGVAPLHSQIHIFKDLPTITGDPVLWRLVFHNLIENSLKACRDVAHPRIEIGCAQSNHSTVCFIRDNGPGIPPDLRPQLFDGTDLRIPSRTGSGLGLSLIKKVIELHSGKIWVADTNSGCEIQWDVR